MNKPLGREQVGQFFSKMAEVQDIVEFEAEEFIAQGDKLVVLGRFAMRVKATGRASRSEWAHAWTIKGGKITHMREYVDTAAVSRAHQKFIEPYDELMATLEQKYERACVPEAPGVPG